MRPQYTFSSTGVVIPVLSVGVEAAIRAFFLYNNTARFIIGEGQMNFFMTEAWFHLPPALSGATFFKGI